jgi:Lrp/AsnC family leucine-responsive transcriptional regulator
MTMALDNRDQQILALLRADAWLSYRAVSRRVNLSASAVQRRVERMIASGVILGARAEVAVQEGQAPLTLFMLAELAEESRAALERFSKRVAGEADVLLKLRLPDLAAYDRFIETHINASALVRRFKTFAALRSLAPTKAG